MKTVGFSILAILSIFSLPTFAKDGGWGSGGGNARVCFNTEAAAKKVIDQKGEITDDLLNQIESIEALDLYEAKLPRGLSGKTIPLAPIRTDETFTQYTDRIINRVVTTVPELGNELLKRRALFTDESVILHDTSLTRIHDEAAVTSTSSANCVLATMAIQQNTGDFWLLHIDNRLFSHPKHSELSRAVLLLHEITYAVARDRGQTESASSRIVVGEMISNAPQTNLSTLMRHWISLGLLNQEGIYKDYPLDTRTAPFMWLSSAMLNLSQDLFFEFASWAGKNSIYDFRIQDGELSFSALEKARRILDELGQHQTLQNAIDALAYLRKAHSDGRFRKLQNPKDAEKALQAFEDFRTQTLSKISAFLNQRYLEKYKQQIVGFEYLGNDQKDALEAVAKRMMNRLIDIAALVMTNDEIVEAKRPHAHSPNIIDFGLTDGVYCLNDLNMHFGTNHREVAEQAQRATIWFRSNLWMMFVTQTGSHLSSTDLPFPTFTYVQVK